MVPLQQYCCVQYCNKFVRNGNKRNVKTKEVSGRAPVKWLVTIAVVHLCWLFISKITQPLTLAHARLLDCAAELIKTIHQVQLAHARINSLHFGVVTQTSPINQLY